MKFLLQTAHFYFYFLFAFVAYWQVGFMQHPLQWDAIDCFLAWRHNVVDCLRNGELPLWSPYSYLGFPLHADPECGAWYPVLWLMAAFRDYDFYSLSFEWCLHVFIAGLGMHLFVSSLGYSKSAAYIAGISFMCSGMFVSNAQNFVYLIGIAWFPWLFMHVRKMFDTLHWQDAMAAALVLFMMVSGSYPGITIISVYVMMAYAIRIIFMRRKEWLHNAQRKRWIKLIAIFIVSSVALCAVVLVSTAEVLPYITRTEGLPPGKILENPFSLKAFVSFVLPFAVGTHEHNWGSDFSMLNAYCGIVTLLFAVYCFIHGSIKRRERMSLLAVVTLLILAMGDVLPFRMWIAQLPGMDLFRHPSIFRFFAIFFICLLGAAGFQKFIQHNSTKPMVIVIGSFVLLFVVVAFSCTPHSMGSTIATALQQWNDPAQAVKLPVSDRVFFQCIMQAALLAGFLLLIYLRRKNLAVLVVALDMIVSIQLNGSATIFSSFNVRELNSKLHAAIESSADYDGRSLRKICDANTELNVTVIWRNESIFTHQPAWDGYNSFKFRGYQKLEDDGNLENEFDHPLVYFSDSTAGTVSKIVLRSNSVSLNLNCNKQDSIRLQQCYSPGWKCFIDDKATEVNVSNHAMMAAEVVPGKHHVVFSYNPLNVLAAMWISASALFLIAFFVLRRNRSNRGQEMKKT